MLCVIPHSVLALPEPPWEPGQPAQLPRSHWLHHYQLSLNSSDHHLNYPLSCPPDGFFANYNFSVDGQGIMTAEACALAAGWNTKKANGCRCGCEIQLLSGTHTHWYMRKYTYSLAVTPKDSKSPQLLMQKNTHTHTHMQTQTPIPPPPVEKPFTDRAPKCQALKWI